MDEECKKPFRICEDLQNLIMITLEHIILPLRKELHKCSEYSEILSLEIQDGENKTFEYIAQQISEINNVDEEVANEILKHFPQSEVCFRCLGIDEDTLHGFLWIRGLDFSHLFDMQKEEVISLLKTYKVSSDDIKHILTGLSKIRGNVELLENGLSFEDDTRNLIKLVIKLTEPSDTTVESPNYSNDSVLRDRLPLAFEARYSSEDASESPHSCSRDRISAGQNFLSDLEDNGQVVTRVPQCTLGSLQSGNTYVSALSSLRSASICESHPVSCFSTGLVNLPFTNGFPSLAVDHATQTLNRASRRSKTPVPFTRLRRALSPGPYRVPSSTNVMEFSKGFTTDGGLSVPATPASKFFGTPVHQKLTVSPVKTVGMSTSFTSANDCTPPHSPYSHYGGFFQKNPQMKDREKGKAIKLLGNSPGKNRIRFPFPLHRSKSHESNLAGRINTQSLAPNINTIFAKLDSTSPKSSSKFSGKAKSPDPQLPPSTICCETSVFRFPTPTHIANSSSSPKTQTQPSNFPLGSRSEVYGTLAVHNEPIASGTNGLLSVPGNPTLIGGVNQALYGYMHKFEMETNIGDIVRGPLCSVCNCRILLRSQHCIYCNLKTHKQCVSNAILMPCPGPSRAFKCLEGQRSSVNCARVNNATGIMPLLSAANLPLGSDSNSPSSCTSCSTPGSPFPLDAGRQTLPTGPVLATARNPSSSSCVHPQAGVVDSAYSTANVGDERLCLTGLVEHASVTPASGPNSPSPTTHNTGQALDPKTGPNSGDDRPRTSTISSCESSRTPINDRLSRLESTESQDDYPIFMRNNSLSVSLKDWNIPMSALQLREMIGRGTFGTVYRGKWHGEVAVKIIDFDPEDPDSRFSVDAFKREVVTLLKTRHENLVLFMGACMKPPNLAIVTQLSKGETLYHLLHFQKQTLSANRAIAIASQIAKGMGYLHARQIVHRDLKTRNIFIEVNFKPVIADFGLFNFVKFCKIAKSGSYVHVPPNWLCYVAPETIRALNIGCADSEAASDLPFTPESDVFAFGTVWYELLTSEYPFKGLPTETLLYLVGNGVKPALQLPCPKDFKEILVQCWSFHPHRRPEFTNIVRLLDSLPKLHRSPSYPTKRPSLANPISHDSLLV